ncbi:hypothetical protein ABT168_11475 [Streptomyces sp. NPDC001793]|uniref:hypothetical protein n=1 Tax=Streptomyces sp. NPDC001793 TaxID=3154657 RepID=UPI00331E08C1
MSTESQPQSQTQPQPPARAGQDTPAPEATNTAPDSADTTPAAEVAAAAPAPTASTASPAPRSVGRKAAGLIFDDPLSRRSSDDTDRGWGERPTASGSAADLARFLDEKPPHHL